MTNREEFPIGTVVVIPSSPDVKMTVSGSEWKSSYDDKFTPCIWFDKDNHLQKQNIKSETLVSFLTSESPSEPPYWNNRNVYFEGSQVSFYGHVYMARIQNVGVCPTDSQYGDTYWKKDK